MNEPEPNFSRMNRKQGRKRSNKILNILTGIVLLLIIIVLIPILTNSKNDEANQEIEKKPLTKEEMVGGESSKSLKDDAEQIETSKETEEDQEVHTDPADEEASGVLKYVSSDDANIVESIIDSSWTPIGTSQTGEHASLYDGKSADWLEKKQALAYAVDVNEESLIFHRIKNGGSAQKSIGILSTKDGAKKFRVFLEWVDGQGWKPAQMDVLNSLDFDY